MLQDVGRFSFQGLQWQSSFGGGHLLQVCCVPHGVPYIIAQESCQPNSVHLRKESLWTQLKTKSQVPRDDVLVDLFMTWWTNWEPVSLSVVSTYVTWSNKRYHLFFKNDIAFVYSHFGRTYQLRITMLCKGFITFSWYWLVLYIKQISFFYRRNFGSPWSASSQGIFG